MRTLTKKLILEEPVDDVVKTPLTEDSLIYDEPIEEPEVESEQVIFDKTGSDFGVASMLNTGIIDEFEAIDTYNSHIITLKDLINQETDDAVIESYKKIIEILTDIVNEENIHVGQLQKALSLVSPSALFIKDGDIEADEVLEEE
jgi:rubrerythrin